MFYYLTLKKTAAIIGLFLMACSLFGIELRSAKENEATVTETRAIDGDYLFWGRGLDFTQSAEDIYFFGESLRFTGSSTGDVTAIGQYVTLDGPIGGNLQAGGDTVTINGNVEDTCFLAGKTIIIGPESVIGGDLLVAGSEITIHGTVNGNIRVGAAYVTIDGIVNGNLIVQAGELVLTERARINGNLIYDTESALDNRAQSRVSGTITKTVFDKEGKGVCSPKEEKDGGKGFLFFMLSATLVSLLAGGLLLLLIPAFGSVFTGGLTGKGFWSALLWGLIPLFLYPVAVAILIPLLPVSIVLSLAGIPLMALAAVLGITRFGEYMFGVFKWKKVNRFQFFLFGLVLLLIPFMIPGLGFLAFLFVAAAGWGVILMQLKKKKDTEAA
jgi:cytoskeletal protein CcmA (bactofilin family)